MHSDNTLRVRRDGCDGGNRKGRGVRCEKSRCGRYTGEITEDSPFDLEIFKCRFNYEICRGERREFSHTLNSLQRRMDSALFEPSFGGERLQRVFDGAERSGRRRWIVVVEKNGVTM